MIHQCRGAGKFPKIQFLVSGSKLGSGLLNDGIPRPPVDCNSNSECLRNLGY
jgi:hypothetical protein